MNTFELQRKIAILEKKLQTLSINHFYDSEYNLIIQKDKYTKKVLFISNNDDLKHINNDKQNIIIDLSNNVINDSLNIIYESDVDNILKLKNILDEDTFSKIVNYVFFNKENKLLFNIINNLYLNKSKKINKNIDTSIKAKKDNVDFNIMEIINKEFAKKKPFKQEKKYYISADKKMAILVMISKRYDHSSYKYWYTFHKKQKEILEKYESSYILLYFNDKNACVIIDTNKLYRYLDKLNKSVNGNNIGWHLHVQEKNDNYQLRIPKNGTVSLDVNKTKGNKDYQEIKESNTIKLSLNDYKIIKMK